MHLYKLTNSGTFSKDFGLRDQIRRAAISVASNIAEGDERNTNKKSVHFLYMAKGSLAEVVTQITIAREIGYLSDEKFLKLQEECERIGGMIGKLIKVRCSQ